MIVVLHPGIYSSIQDLGRSGFADIAMPIGGAMDVYSATVANQLLRNTSTAAVLEMTFGGMQLQFEKEVCICLTGADFNPVINGEAIAMNTVIKAAKGSVLSFGKKRYGVRTYLAVAGGFDTAVVLKSRSFYKGVTERSQLVKGDRLLVQPSEAIGSRTQAKVKVNESHFSSRMLSVSKGPEFELLSERQQAVLLQTVFTISNDNNRVGYRLEAPLKNSLQPILTSGVLPGTVQLTPSGTLLVLMRDCQVTGGYPRVLQLCEAGINRLAQKSTTDRVQFVLS